MDALTRKVYCVAAIFCVLGLGLAAHAAELFVGPGQTYLTIQSAVDAAASGDTITVYAGNYDEYVSIDNTAPNAPSGLTLRANPGDRVYVHTVNIKGTSSLQNSGNVIEGFFLSTQYGTACHSNYARNNTWRNLVVYNCAGAAFGGTLMYGGDIIENCTVYNCSRPGSYGYKSGAALYNSVFANCIAGWIQDATSTTSYAHCCWYNNPVGFPGWEDPEVVERSGYAGTSINANPRFLTTNYNSTYALWLESASPCSQAGIGGANMGACPTATAAEEIHVGYSGQPYSVIQAAVDAADAGDVIIIHEGVYDVGFAIRKADGLENMTVRANYGDKVLVKGSISILGVESPRSINTGNLIEGLHISVQTYGSNCASTRANKNTWRNLVIFNTDRNPFYGYDMSGYDIIEHCTVYNAPRAASYSYGGAYIYDSIIAFNAAGWTTGAGGYAYYANTCWYNNPAPNAGNESTSVLPLGGDETGNVYADPMFVMTAPLYSPYLLWLNSSASPCVGTAGDGGNIGALPDTDTTEFSEDPNAIDDPNWSIQYHGQGWPSSLDLVGYPTRQIEAVDWDRYTYYGAADLQTDLSDAYFRMRTSPGGYLWYSLYDPASTSGTPANRIWNVDFSVGVTVEARIKCFQYSGQYVSDGGTTLVLGDGTGYAYINLRGDPDDSATWSVTLGGSPNVTTTAINTTEWHTYRVVVKGDVAGLFVDGAKLPVLVTNLNPATTIDKIYWGDTSPTGGGYAYWDYIKVCMTGAANELPGDFVASVPAENGTLYRALSNQIKIVSSKTIPDVPAEALKLTQIGTQTVIDPAGFTYSLETTTLYNDTLVATANAPILEDKAWYRVERGGDLAWISDFQVTLTTLRGDFDQNGSIDIDDFAALSAAWTLGGADSVDLAALASNWLETGVSNPMVNVSFTKFPENPILTFGVEPSGPVSQGVLHVCVRQKDASSPYMMWYSADGSGVRRIYLATSTDKVNWTKQVLAVSGTSHVSGPTVLWDEVAGLWKMWYGGYQDGYQIPGSDPSDPRPNWVSIHYATSPDGYTWTKYGEVLSSNYLNYGTFDYATVRTPSVLYDAQDGLYKMWYMGTAEIEDHSGPLGYATSPDGVNWTRVAQINQSSSMQSPDVIKLNGVYYMFHNATNIGYAVSLDGIAWDNYPQNPVLSIVPGTFEASYIQGASILYEPADNKLYLFYNGGDYALEQDGTQVGAAWTSFMP